MTQEKTPIRIYGLYPYDRSAKARWLLTEVGAAFEDRWLDREKKEYDSPAYLEMNPMGRIPVLEMKDATIFESGAICSFLADRYIDRGVAPGHSSPDRAKYLQWMFFAASTLDTFQARIMIIEDIPEGDVKRTKENALLSEVRDAMNALDLGLRNGSYLVGNRFTAADLCVGYHLYWLRLWPELDAIIGDFPRVTAYLDRLKAMPSAVKAGVFTYKD
jgi:glutathione S-transferase